MLKKIRKKKFKALCKLLLGGVAFVGSMFMNQDSLNAMPIEDTTSAYASLKNVVYNETLKSVTGSNVTNGFISWKDFSLANGDKLTFSGMTNMLNYVPFKNPSLIYGEIDASAVSGNFYIVNPSGILFGQDSKVIANDFHVSTRYLSEDDIKNYKLGTNPFDTNATASLINKNGLSSSDIMGAYDIADGDVMFLGKVQANSLKVEGNTIQIRNTKDITTNGTNKLTDVTLYSNNSPEVGYEVGFENPFDYSTEDAFITGVAKYYGIDTTADDNNTALSSIYTFYKSAIDDLDANDNKKVLIPMALDKVIRA
ncbi:MAG: filamentous hemagglutinin N-terminal domain-containing protein, partial [Selenomonadaceae bacterium]|nr:filamentous hemagglutinin N-terminal domain-containing protein [Selenomonadaceae bacterium]